LELVGLEAGIMVLLIRLVGNRRVRKTLDGDRRAEPAGGRRLPVKPSSCQIIRCC
jgi:hypothetical protein